MHYTGQVYRHPIEGYTPLLEVTAGCSHNKCSFCTMYRETPFKLSPLEYVEQDLQELKQTHTTLEKIFLVNGEPFILSTEKLIKIGELINSYFPEIKTITCYASIKSLKSKSVEDLKKLRALKFNELHIGLESAYDPAIMQMNKGFTQEEAYENIAKLKEAGFDWDAIVMLGVAGKGKGKIHIRETAKLLNTYPPYLVSIMTTSISDDTPLEKMRDDGDFIECTELEKIEEEKLLLELLEFDDAYFFGGHMYNLIAINGPLSKKDKILERIDKELQKIDPKILNSSYQRDNI
ncbi:MAG: radical SAM protein [Epulopiscium sp. Nuni2H_MBin001]|nr:MAG: radical SAM protein [Epulopiscium sp. Nuni2H_MBin001]